MGLRLSVPLDVVIEIDLPQDMGCDEAERVAREEALRRARALRGVVAVSVARGTPPAR